MLASQLELGNLSLWKYLAVEKLVQAHEPRIHRVICEYDFLGLRRPKIRQGHDEMLRFLDTAHEITFITLWAPPDVLTGRLRLRQPALLKFLLKLLKSRHTLRRTRALLTAIRTIERLYGDSLKLLLLYETWFQFCGRYDAKAHWLMDTTEQVSRLSHISKWSDIRSRLQT